MTIRWLALAVFALIPISLSAQEAKENPAFEQLRALRKNIETAINKNDLDTLLTYLDDDVVITWQNAEVSRGHKAVKEFYEQRMTAPGHIVVSLTINPQTDFLTQLYGDNTTVATGSSEDRFKLNDGKLFTVTSRWTALAIRKDGAWKIAAFHTSTNMFDNPIMANAVRQTLIGTAGVAVPAGLALGFLFSMLLKRRPDTPPPPAAATS